MKKISIVPLLAGLCFVMMGVVIFSMVTSLMGYDPARYITLGDYKGISLSFPEEQPTQEEIQSAMAQVLAQFATTEEITQDAALGDTLTVDYVGNFLDDQQEPLTDSSLEMVLGNEEFVVPGMDSYLVGAKVNQTVSATLTVPENYHVSDYVGRQIAFQVTVKKMVRTTLPELTDDFVKTLGDYTSAEDFKVKFAEKYKSEKALEHQASMRSALWDKAVENATVKGYPQKELDALITEFEAGVQKGAADFELEYYDYAALAYGKETKEEFDAFVLDYNQSVLKQQMVLKAIAEEEGLKVTQTEYDTRLAEYLTLYEDEGYTKEDILEIFGGEEGLKEQFLLEMVTDVIEQNAVVTE
ncbi:MAG: FKBP-type peptidyl-prolyl cis-trans isomerase [Clostridia bacterium]|nr:FKBP-type peptidyl-prolyl cis-trans isomerase [Clostridia bacterium]